MSAKINTIEKLPILDRYFTVRDIQLNPEFKLLVVDEFNESNPEAQFKKMRSDFKLVADLITTVPSTSTDLEARSRGARIGCYNLITIKKNSELWLSKPAYLLSRYNKDFIKIVLSIVTKKLEAIKEYSDRNK